MPTTDPRDELTWRFRLEPSAVLNKISESTDADGSMLLWWLTEWGRKKDVVAKIDGNRFRLRMRQFRSGLWFRPGSSIASTSNPPLFSGRIEEHGRDSIIRGHFERLFIGRWFWTTWVSFVILFSFVAIPMGTIAVLGGDLGALMLILVPPAMLGMGSILYRMDKARQQNDKKELVEFLNALAADPG